MTQEKKSKKQISVLVTSTPVTVARKEAFGNAETGETDENGENIKNGDEDLRTSLA